MTDVCPHGRRYFEMDYQGEIHTALICSECVHERKLKARRAGLVWQAAWGFAPHFELWGGDNYIIERAAGLADAFLAWESKKNTQAGSGANNPGS